MTAFDDFSELKKLCINREMSEACENLINVTEILKKCGMSEIYIVNPYECFLLMCLLTDCPLAVFADIWEMSYEEDKQEE